MNKKIAVYCNAWDTNAGGGIVYILDLSRVLSHKNLITNSMDSIKKSIIMLYYLCQSEPVQYSPAQLFYC